MHAKPSPRPARLLLVVDSLDVGGAERHVVNLALALRREGHEVTVACSTAGALAAPLREVDLPVVPLMERLVKRRFSPAYALALRRLVKERRYDLVHAHLYASAAASAAATLGTGVPLVVTEHTEASWQGRRAGWVNRWFCRRAEAVIAVSTPIRRRLIQRDNVPPGRISVIPNALAPVERAPLAASPALPDGWRGSPLIGIIARLQPEKGVPVFLKAAARVAPLFPQARFLVVGDGPLREELTALAEDLDLSGRVRFLGFHPDAAAIIEFLQVLVVPSRTEGAPLAVLEAMAAGVPVIASAVGGIPDQVGHGREGLLVPPGDATAFGDAILDLLRRPDRARRLGEAGRRRVASRFGYATMLRRTEAVYEAILGRPVAKGTMREDPGPWVAE